MKIAIVTLPLHTNYGGLLQAYALKTLLEEMGHEVTVLDLAGKVFFPKPSKALFVYMKRALIKALKGNAAPEVFREFRLKSEYPVISSCISEFTDKYIRPRVLNSYSELKESDYEAFVVGSDQVWRPEYFRPVQEAFLRFAADWDVKRVAYAASFGTDELEYEYTLLEECSGLLAKFDAVSVRELSGVKMCDEWFDCEHAVHVLDPVMMLPVADYEAIACKEMEKSPKGGVLTYILDKSDVKTAVAGFVSRATGMEIHDVSVYPKESTIPLEQRIVPSMEKWLSAFLNASFVVTDSFHGCVLSIMFHKPFLVVGNKARGMSRIDSLLGLFSLEHRLVDGIDPDDDGEGWLMELDWKHVDAVLSQYQESSRDFLASVLKVDGTSDSRNVETD